MSAFVSARLSPPLHLSLYTTTCKRSERKARYPCKCILHLPPGVLIALLGPRRNGDQILLLGFVAPEESLSLLPSSLEFDVFAASLGDNDDLTGLGSGAGDMPPADLRGEGVRDAADDDEDEAALS